jgi:hypothetical protein
VAKNYIEGLNTQQWKQLPTNIKRSNETQTLFIKALRGETESKEELNLRVTAGSLACFLSFSCCTAFHSKAPKSFKRWQNRLH